MWEWCHWITSSDIHSYIPSCGFFYQSVFFSSVAFRWCGIPHNHLCGFGLMLSEQLGLTCLLLITWLHSLCSFWGYVWKRYCLHVGEPHKHDFRLWNQGLASFSGARSLVNHGGLWGYSGVARSFLLNSTVEPWSEHFLMKTVVHCIG